MNIGNMGYAHQGHSNFSSMPQQQYFATAHQAGQDLHPRGSLPTYGHHYQSLSPFPVPTDVFNNPGSTSSPLLRQHQHPYHHPHQHQQSMMADNMPAYNQVRPAQSLPNNVYNVQYMVDMQEQDLDDAPSSRTSGVMDSTRSGNLSSDSSRETGVFSSDSSIRSMFVNTPLFEMQGMQLEPNSVPVQRARAGTVPPINEQRRMSWSSEKGQSKHNLTRANSALLFNYWLGNTQGDPRSIHSSPGTAPRSNEVSVVKMEQDQDSAMNQSPMMPPITVLSPNALPSVHHPRDSTSMDAAQATSADRSDSNSVSNHSDSEQPRGALQGNISMDDLLDHFSVDEIMQLAKDLNMP